MNTEPFDHGFKNTLSNLDVAGIVGYHKCLTHFYSLIAELTKYKTENRMIDAVILLEKISATSDELKPLLLSEQTRLLSSQN